MTIFFSLCEYIISFLEFFTCFIFCASFMRKDALRFSELKFPAIYAAIVALVGIIFNNIKIISPAATLIMTVAIIIGQVIFNRAHIIKAVGFVLFFLAILLCVDLLTSSFVSGLLKISLTELLNDFSMERIIAALGSKGLTIITCFFINRLRRDSTSISKRSLLVISAFSLLMIFLCFSLFFVNADTVHTSNMSYFLFILFIIILGLIIAMYCCMLAISESNERKNELELIKLRNETLHHSLTDLENTYSMWRKNIHDYKNNIIAMNDMLENNYIDELKKYLSSEIDSFTYTNNYVHSGNSTVDAVISSKIIEAEKHNIHVTVNVYMPSDCNISSVHLASVLGNLLDNAIEASLSEEKPYIHIQISLVNSYLMIKVINKCTKENISVSTTKTDKIHHGIGIESIKSIVEMYNGNFSLKLSDGEAVADSMFFVEF